MANVHINIGSNQNRYKNIQAALKALESIFSNLQTSSLYESPAEGFLGDNFYNIGVNMLSHLSIADTLKILREIENNQGRNKSEPKFSSRSIDLDLVLYDCVVDKNYNLPRDDILKYAFVLAPLAELSPDVVHPLENQSYQALWQAFKLRQKYYLTQYNIDEFLQITGKL